MRMDISFSLSCELLHDEEHVKKIYSTVVIDNAVTHSIWTVTIEDTRIYQSVVIKHLIKS